MSSAGLETRGIFSQPDTLTAHQGTAKAWVYPKKDGPRGDLRDGDQNK